LGINVHVKDERGEVLRSALDPAMLLSRFAAHVDAQGSQILRYLDPYGDLILNRSQATALIEDLAGIIPRQEGALRSLLEQVRACAEAVERDRHLYLWFEGD
jgi:hypothetical protein